MSLGSNFSFFCYRIYVDIIKSNFIQIAEQCLNARIEISIYRDNTPKRPALHPILTLYRPAKMLRFHTIDALSLPPHEELHISDEKV